MSLAYTVVTRSIKQLTRMLCNIDSSELSKVPDYGPLIIASNHINFLEVPLLYTHLQPRVITGFAKAETWKNPVLGYLFSLWGAIPLRRGEADTVAFRNALVALKQGKILAIAPEGTRSEHGKLQSGLPGIITLASLSRSPILPLVFYGGEKIRDNLNQLKRTDFHIRVGNMFKLTFPENKIDHNLRKVMVDEIMYQLALLLPHEYRGHYADISRVSTNHIYFL